MLKIKEIKPLFTSILTTGNKYEKDVKEGGIITNKKGDLKLYQKVLAVGSSVRDIKVGDMIMFSPKDYVVMKYDPNSVKNDMDMNKVVKMNLPWVTITKDNQTEDCLLLKDRDVLFVFEGEEVVESDILIPDNKVLILN
jgi:co-chaperonin GroES (HSP10)